ncbi:carboxypeptidase-like regulatory domain-containing protein [Hymenobacter psychrophilus]|uniref:Carboxypeptidase regulatory-like domain-containing protein n=1 Tax=Hymenobacter psychrophilus TaxID=651662 RepID=A0A1H3FTU8_9BACT|nr:carboxypeptidase-like regulatory domain-containing protein [Hymenobacter psychrophilus]SDX94482.1 Carboxypeptidase regulatory-like domain-containing protein [Hymenobacter psychrophilus]
MPFARFLLLLFCCFAAGASAQTTAISGTVRDSVTRAPLGFASVFLANTTYGSTTDEQGRYVLPDVPPGRYDFVVSYVGYRLYQRSVELRGPAAMQLTPLIAPLSNQLREVIVKGRRHRNISADYWRFVALFLGNSSFSQQCRIINPRDVIVRYDARRQRLTASSARFVAIENRALGYLVRYHGFQFEADLSQQTVTFLGQPVFSELSARQNRPLWEKNRKTAYYGSLSHFLRAVHDDQVTAQGYLVQRTRQVANAQRAQADTLLRQQRAAAAVGPPFVPNDSLLALLAEPRLYRYVYTQPMPIDSVRRLGADGTHWLRFTDQLLVTYGNEPPDPQYRPPAIFISTTPPAPTKQISTLYLLRPGGVRLLANGQMAEPLAVFTDGYWGFEKMGEFLPLDYSPYPPLPSGQKP